MNDGWVDQFTSSVAGPPGNVGVTLEIYDDEAKKLKCRVAPRRFN